MIIPAVSTHPDQNDVSHFHPRSGTVEAKNPSSEYY